MSGLCRCWAVCLLVGSGLLFADDNRLVNQLGDHPSPYLAMHAEDPVHWQAWNSATVREAIRLNRPMLISIGYFACHWCHVMQRESYQDPLLAKLLNQSYIPVKVDRELDPALDAHLIEFVELTRGQAGWPLNVLLTPDGYPLSGVTYLPRDQFYLMLSQFAQRWQTDEARIRIAAGNAMQEWGKIRQAGSRRDGTTAAPETNLRRQAEQLRDELDGGFGEQNKFPMVSQMMALMRASHSDETGETAAFIRTTLERMAGQGLHDNLGGGFFRYVIDPGWQVPHYEKMLYDNAQLAMLYFRAWKVFASKDYLQVGRSTVDFMLAEMLQGGSAFISSFSAVDQLGREGFYYQWNDEQLGALLNPDEHKAVMSAWFGARAPESEYGRLPRWQADTRTLAAKLDWPPDKLNASLQSARVRLLAARQQRQLPADDKVIAAWNGLALSALAAAYEATGADVYRIHADRLADYLMNALWDGENLQRFVSEKTAATTASLEDYALVAQGLFDWGRQHPQRGKACRALAETLVRLAWERYFINDRWRLTDAPLIPMLDGKLALADDALPSASAVISRISLEHGGLRNDKSIQEALQRHLDVVAAELMDEIFWYASYVELLPGAQR